MRPEEKRLQFLLGANTPQGFVSRFDQLVNPEEGWKTYIIKGGPGSGKSTLMKRVAEALEEECPGMEYIHCSSDVESMDALVLPEKKAAILDGNPPHSLEPRYPGVVESLVDLTSCWDERKLAAHREEIVRLTGQISRCHEHCCRFLAAASSLLGDSYRVALGCVDLPKLNAYLGRLSEKELKRKAGPPLPGKEQVRFLTALTNQGVIQYTNTAKLLAQRIYLINDEYGAVSRLTLHYIRSKALEAGYDVISCYCPLSPFEKLEQLFIPELSLGFLTSNRFHSFDLEIDPYRIINCQRFTDSQKLKEPKRQLTFNRKAAAQMLAQGEGLIQEAKELHDQLEQYYTGATSFKKVDRLTQQLIQKLQSQSI